MIAALVIGALLAAGALAFVLYPLFFGVRRQMSFVAPAPRLNEGESAVAARDRGHWACVLQWRARGIGHPRDGPSRRRAAGGESTCAPQH